MKPVNEGKEMELVREVRELMELVREVKEREGKGAILGRVI